MYATTTTRRLFAFLVATVVCTVTTIMGGVAPAYAAVSGQLLMKGTGSVYTDNHVVFLGATPGVGTKVFSFKVVNTGTVSQAFKVTVEPSGPGFTANLFKGYQAVSSPFSTAPIPPGGNVVLTLKVAVSAGQAQGQYYGQVLLQDPLTELLLDQSFAVANATYQKGTTQHDLFLKTGSQPFVGGSVEQNETASAIRVGGTATFTLRLKNNGATPATITLNDGTQFECVGNFVVTVKQGATNVSAAVHDGTYSTGTLNPGAKKELKVSIKLIADDDPDCMEDYFIFEATGPDGHIDQFAHVVIAD